MERYDDRIRFTLICSILTPKVEMEIYSTVENRIKVLNLV
ncbi:hypothetical protein LEP1GSC188_1039 [Leptospira weilii serovar Topaz str. LT2116]|uniref:Uncharacterized protein n=1 Tax=Leptospira weilii serovar Topaz str. LT2116 TaxID=1088540 RepID=M3GUU6_9LEPT|nr:hypothetical protein LEP1GSC188_1039 [Leptospira weilii serovar Topaz str. LT2116]